MSLETLFKAYQSLPASQKEQFLVMIKKDTEGSYTWATSEFFTEMERRINDVKSGKVKAIPADEFFTKLYSELPSA